MDPPNKRVKLDCISFESMIWGNFNQFDINIFSNEISRGRQCTASAVCFLAFSKIIHEWNYIDIDNILIIGDFIYNLSARNHNLCGKYLAADHIVQNIYIPACGFLEDDCVIKCERQKNTQGGLKFGESGLKRLQKCLNNFDHCVVTCCSLSFAIHKSKNCFYFFDSHGRSASGLRTSKQPAAIITFYSIDGVYNAIMERDMFNSPFDITPFRIHEASKEDAAAVEKMVDLHKLKYAVDEQFITLENLPKKVDERIYIKYENIDKSIYLNAPAKIENVHRRVRNIPVDRFPGAIQINGRLEFFVDSVLQEVHLNDIYSKHLQKMFIVIWCGWPDDYATIEPEENLQHCAALMHYVLAKQGKLTGTSAGKCCTAIRSTKIKKFATKNQQQTEISFSMDFQRLFNESEAVGDYNPLVGMIGNDRTAIFLSESAFFTKVLGIVNHSRRGYYLSRRIWGNYFGRAMKNTIKCNEITTSKLCNKKKTLITDLNQSWRDTHWNENNEKISMFLMISQVGEFEADMNAVSTKSRFKTHAQLFVARKSKITGQTYFCIDPQYIAPTEKSNPLAFLRKKPHLPYTKHINMVHGTQTTTDDCFYRIFQYIDKIVSGNFNFDEKYIDFKVGTKFHKQ